MRLTGDMRYDVDYRLSQLASMITALSTLIAALAGYDDKWTTGDMTSISALQLATSI
jgi:hypothetical protein